jgi:serine phosphatase RsbU (regulator of sigma subunit)/anti-sigma regulatory factor (Ser/Thr protein kinase)/uncharacterized protein YigA (DUF484 family)
MDSADCQRFAGVSLRLGVRSSLAAAREASIVVREFLRGHGIEAEELAGWELALVEAANNVAEHGNTGTEDEFFEIDVAVTPEDVTLRLTDRTAGFEYPDQVGLPDSMSEGGRGLFLIENLCDQVSYMRGRGGNCMTLRKRRTRPAEVVGSTPEDSADVEALRAENVELNEALDGMTEELASSYESLAAIFKFSQELGKQRDLSDFAHLLLDHLKKITESDWYVLRVRDTDAGLSAFAVSDTKLRLPVLSTRTSEASCERQAIVERQDVWIEGGLPEGEPLTVFANTRAGIVHPFYLNDELVGTLALGTTQSDRPLSAGQVNVLHTFSDFLALQILNARYQDGHVKTKVVSRELEIAANIQRSLLPRSLPASPRFGIAGFYQSAQSVGGDFYDAVTTPCGGLLLTIADVMGKGVPAAMFSAILRTVLRAQQELAAEPAALLRRANQILFEDLDRVDMFITAQLVYLSPDGTTGACAGAGHCPLLVGNPLTGDYFSIEADGPPLGVMMGMQYQDHEFDLAPGARLILYTDGVTEARSTSGELWGDERMLAWWKRATAAEDDAESLKTSLIDEVKTFVGDAAATDDLTFVVLAEKTPN